MSESVHPNAEQVAWATMVMGTLNQRHSAEANPGTRAWLMTVALTQLIVERDARIRREAILEADRTLGGWETFEEMIVALVEQALAAPTRADDSPPSQDLLPWQRKQNEAFFGAAPPIPPSEPRVQAGTFETLIASKNADQAIEDCLERMFGPAMNELVEKGSQRWRWPFHDWHWDYYDGSLEITSADVGLKLTDAQQAILWEEGFTQCWLTRTDNTCTHYHRKGKPSVGRPSASAVRCPTCEGSMRQQIELRDARAALAARSGEADVLAAAFAERDAEIRQAAVIVGLSGADICKANDVLDAMTRARRIAVDAARADRKEPRT